MAFENRDVIWRLSLILVLCINFCKNEFLEQHPDANLLGRPGEGYYIGVLIGDPPQKFNVLIDTGSTNFAIAASPNPNIEKYFRSINSSTFKSRNKKVSVLYTQGNWTGELGNDILNFPSLKSRTAPCDIALIQTSSNFYMNGSQWQGILGLAYSLIVRPDSSVISWLDALKNQYNRSDSVVFSLELCGSKPLKNHHTGRLSVMEEVKAPQVLLTTPIIKEWFYEVLLSGVAVGNKSVDLPCREFNTDKTIVDSGTTNLRFPEKVFSAVVNLIVSEIDKYKLTYANDFWTQQKMNCRHQEWEWDKFPNISLNLTHSDNSYFTLEITPQSYIRMVYDNVETNQHQYCYKFAIESSDTGSVLGVVVMEGFYVVFNRTAKEIGFGKSKCGPPVSLHGPYTTDKDLRNVCANSNQVPNLGALQTFAYVVAGLLCVCSIVFVFYFTKWFWEIVYHKRIRQTVSETSLISEDEIGD